jgi:plasmid stabilization system protein ParE
MSLILQYASRAFEDVQSGYQYYNIEASPTIADRFLDEVQKTLESIKRNPYAYRVRYADIRCAVLRIFPYLVHYRVSEQEQSILILAVANTYQKPIW